MSVTISGATFVVPIGFAAEVRLPFRFEAIFDVPISFDATCRVPVHHEATFNIAGGGDIDFGSLVMGYNVTFDIETGAEILFGPESAPPQAAGSGQRLVTQRVGDRTTPRGQWQQPVSAAPAFARLNLVRIEGGGWGIAPNPADARFVEIEGGGLGVEEDATSGRKLARTPAGNLIIYQ